MLNKEAHKIKMGIIQKECRPGAMKWARYRDCCTVLSVLNKYYSLLYILIRQIEKFKIRL